MRTWRHALLLCATLAAAAGAVYASRSTELYGQLELKCLDWRFRRFPDPERRDPRLVLAMLDQESLDHFEADQVPWPWPRSMYAAALDFLRVAGAKASVFDILFTSQSPYGAQEDAAFAQAVERARRAGVEVLFAAELSRRASPAPGEPPSRFALELPEGLESLAVAKRSARLPLAELLGGAAAVGDVVMEPDLDGVYRRVPLFSEVGGRVYPSLPVAVAQAVSGERRIEAREKGLGLAGSELPLTDGRLLLRFHGSALSSRPPGGKRTYATHRLGDLILSWQALGDKREPAVPPADLKGKVVFIGYSAAGLLDNRPSPVSAVFPGTEVLAVAVDNLLNGDPLVPARRGWVLVVILLAAALGAAAAVAPSRFAVSAAVLPLASLALASASVAAFRRGVWLDMAGPQLSLVFGFAAAAAYSYAVEGRQRRWVQTAFSRYLSPHVVRELVDDPSKLALGGERREITIFFSDIAGFTTISEGLDPKALTRLMNRYLGEMTDIILELDGTLDKYVGDAIMAFWGAPLDAADHAERACRAAIANQERLASLRAELEREGLPPVAVRIGVNSGAASVGNMGSKRRFNYTALGDAVNLASRLEGINKYYGTDILISETTEALARGLIETRELDSIKVKGKNKPVAIYELLGLRGKTPAGRLALREPYAQGLAAYRRREWDAAEAAFAPLAERKDAPSALLLARCRQYRQEAPSPEWDGSYAMSEK